MDLGRTHLTRCWCGPNTVKVCMLDILPRLLRMSGTTDLYMLQVESTVRAEKWSQGGRRAVESRVARIEMGVSCSR